eukprot:SAG22_NODE_146_length_17566_cov_17.597847_4_plen_96_part_00
MFHKRARWAMLLGLPIGVYHIRLVTINAARRSFLFTKNGRALPANDHGVGPSAVFFASELAHSIGVFCRSILPAARQCHPDPDPDVIPISSCCFV